MRIRQHATVDQLISRLYASITEPVRWEAVAGDISRLFGSRGQLCVSVDRVSGQTLREQANGYAPDFLSYYNNEWLLKDPRFEPGFLLPARTVFTKNDILRISDYRRSEIFNELLRDVDAPWMLAAWLKISPRCSTFFSMNSSFDRGPYPTESRLLFARLVPHIARSLELMDRLQTENLRIDTLLADAGPGTFDLLILDDRGLILEASTAGLRRLEQYGAIHRPLGGKHTFSEPLLSKVRNLQCSLMRSGAIEDGALPVPGAPRKSGVSLMVLPTPKTLGPWLPASATWIALLIDPARRETLARQHIQERFSLTSREAEAALGMLRDTPPAELATHMGVSIQTLRSHLKQVYSKCGVHRRVELIRVLADELAAHGLAPNGTGA